MLLARTDLSLAEAKNRSIKEDKLIYVSYTADWCLPCQMMKEGAYKDQRINFLLLNGMIPVQVEEENFRSKEWIVKYNVTSLPLTLILDKNGNVIERLEGFKSVESIRVVLDRYSRAKTDNLNLNNVPIVFKPKKKVRNFIPIPVPSPPRKKTEVSKHVVVEKNRDIAIDDLEISSTLYPTIYGIQLNSFNSIYDATEYQEYVNKFFSKEALILTSDNEKVYKVIFACKSLDEAKEQIKAFNFAELNCFIRVL